MKIFVLLLTIAIYTFVADSAVKAIYNHWKSKFVEILATVSAYVITVLVAIPLGLYIIAK
jgi:hypothetical protein